MVKRLGMQTLCEGIETADQLEFLRAVGCEKGQGYLFGKPLRHDEVMAELAARANRKYEDFSDDAYLDAVGQISLIDGSSAATTGIEAASFVGREPIAIAELRGGAARLLAANAAFQRVLDRVGFHSFDAFLEYSTADDVDLHKHAVETCLRSKETGAEQTFDFIANGWFCTVTTSFIAEAGDRVAYLIRVIAVEGAPQVTEGILLSGVLEAADRNIFWKDIHRRFLGANQLFLDYYGFEGLDVIIGKTDEDMGWHNDEEPFRSDEMRVLAGEEIHDAHGTCYSHGELRNILANKRPLRSGNRIIGLVGYFEDVGPASDDPDWTKKG